MTEFIITREQINKVIEFINYRQSLRAKSLLQNLKVLRKNPKEINKDD